jgi:hypothetical protein
LTPTELLTTIKRHGATLFLQGERLRLRAPDGFPDELKAQAKAHRDELIGLLRTHLPSPRDHFLGLADGYEEVGIVGRLGSLITGDLWLAVQRWESAQAESHAESLPLESAYWDLVRGHFPHGL